MDSLVQQISSNLELGIPAELDKRQYKICNNLLEALKLLESHSSALATIKKHDLVTIVDNAVINDDVGFKLYQLGWEGKKPDYIKESWFVQQARLKWEKLGKVGQEKYKKELMWVSDKRTHRYLSKCSEKELFEVFFNTEILPDEKYNAKEAMFSIARRSIRIDEYSFWAKRFKVDLPTNM